MSALPFRTLKPHSCFSPKRWAGGSRARIRTFVSDGTTILTRWRVADPDTAIALDRRSNVGLHHLALTAADDTALMKLYGRVRGHPSVEIEMAPALIHESVAQRHFFWTMPGGLRIEFATPFD
jgi:catechol 2,3-dioxygenase-like lactoylglutathione lyase family enzyme